MYNSITNSHIFPHVGFLIPALALVLIQFAKCDKVVGKNYAFEK